MSSNTGLINQGNYEDVLTWAVPLTSALAGFNFSTLFPGTNSILVAAVFGFLAKFLVGLQQTLQNYYAAAEKQKLSVLLKNYTFWEDLIPVIAIALGAFAQALQSNYNWLAYATVIGFIAKALGHWGKNNESGALEDFLLALGAIVLGIGTAESNPTLVSLAALISLIGKTIPSIGTTGPTGKGRGWRARELKPSNGSSPKPSNGKALV
jgi:hypothetical protein